MTVYAVAMQKGGVGKTTTTRNLGAALAARGRKVLLIDLDQQANLTLSFGVSSQLERHAYQLLIDPDVSLADVLIYEPDTNVGLVPTNQDLAGAEVDLLEFEKNNLVLKNKLAPYRNRVDYILIDCPPSLGILTVNALTAADGVIIPVQTHYLALNGLKLLTDTIVRVQKHENPDLYIAGILATMYDGRARHDREVLAELRKRYPDELIDIPIPSRVAIRDAMTAQESIDSFDPNADIVQVYKRIAEVIDRERE